jgi:hypothetical protein
MDRENAERQAHEAYQDCIDDVTGAFSSAPIEVVRDCRKRTGWEGA